MTVAIDPSVVQVGEAVHHRGATIAPLFPRATPRAAYIALDEAMSLGLRVEEVDEAGDVSTLRVVNPTAARVLLYDGEELTGAKQDRILDVPVLVEAGGELVIPVSCVEQGRWRRQSAAFSPSSHASHPELRRRKAEHLAASAMPGAAQHAVWEEVAAKSERLGVRSATGAQGDAYSGYRAPLEEMAARFPLQPGQCGAVLALSGRVVCLDMVSRPDVFARIYPKLLAGYMLDALEHVGGAETPNAAIARFVADAVAAPATRRPAVGLGEALQVAQASLVGSGLALDGELVQLSAHTR